MGDEKGTVNGVESFHHNLPMADMLCEVSLFLSPSDNAANSAVSTTSASEASCSTSTMARFFCADCGLKLGPHCDAIIHRDGAGREAHTRIPYKPKRWDLTVFSDEIDSIPSFDNFNIGANAEAIGDDFLKVKRHPSFFLARPIKNSRILVESVVHDDHDTSSKSTASGTAAEFAKNISFILNFEKSVVDNDIRFETGEEVINLSTRSSSSVKSSKTESKTSDAAKLNELDVAEFNELDVVKIEHGYYKSVLAHRVWKSIEFGNSFGQLNMAPVAAAFFGKDETAAKTWLDATSSATNSSELLFADMVADLLKKQ